MAEVVAAVAISTAIGALGGLLFKQETEQVIAEERPPTLTQRGSFLPVVIGRHRIGPVVGWVGDRDIRRSSAGGKGGGGGNALSKSMGLSLLVWESVLVGRTSCGSTGKTRSSVLLLAGLLSNTK